MHCMHRTIGRDGNSRPFRLRRAGAALLNRFCRCRKRHTEVGRLKVVTEADYGDYAFRLVVSHCPTLSVRQREMPPRAAHVIELSKPWSFRQLTFPIDNAVTSERSRRPPPLDAQGLATLRLKK
jgi:hypothetical protein